MKEIFQFLFEHTWLAYAVFAVLMVFAIVLIRAVWRGQPVSIGPFKIGNKSDHAESDEDTKQKTDSTTTISAGYGIGIEDWLSGPLSITRSIVNRSGKKDVRNPDSKVVTDIMSEINGPCTYEDENFSFINPSSHLLVIGSTRHNPHATQIQKSFHLPYQYVVSHHNDTPENSILMIVTPYGEELTSSRDKGIILESEMVDYGILFLGRLSNQKNILWMSGIHGAGTLGVYEYYKTHREDILINAPRSEGTGAAWLMRVRYKRLTLSAEDEIISVECLGNPLQCGKRPILNDPRRIIISDLGNVIMYFDRSRTYRGIAHTCGLPYEEVVSRIEESNILEQYELGEMNDEVFGKKLAAIVGDSENCLSASFIFEIWGDIFWPNKAMIIAFSKLREQKVPIILLSNTNNIHFQHIMKYYPEVKTAFDDAVLSYECKKAKPEGAIFIEAIERAKSRGVDTRNSDIIYIDDKKEYVEIAKKFGMEGFVYISYPQFAYWLRKMGLYID